VDADDTTNLSYQIEQWDQSHKVAYIWVNVPQIDNSNSDYIYMYYGNIGVPDGQDVKGTWNSNFIGVWHLNDYPDGATVLQAKDSTSNDKTLISQPTLNPTIYSTTISPLGGTAVNFINGNTGSLWYTKTPTFISLIKIMTSRFPHGLNIKAMVHIRRF